MRITLTAVAASLAAAALAGTAAGRPTLTYQINVTFSDRGCVLETSVSRRNTSILFHVINDGAVAHDFTVWGVRSGWIKPHQEGRFLVKFRGPGAYAFTCKAQGRTLRRGHFTIRRT